MVTLNDDPNTWGEHQLHEYGNLDEETDTCVGVRDRSCSRATSNFHVLCFRNLGRGRQTRHRTHKLPLYIKKRGSSRRAVHPRPLLTATATVS